jgi:hypothetical protein
MHSADHVVEVGPAHGGRHVTVKHHRSAILCWFGAEPSYEYVYFVPDDPDEVVYLYSLGLEPEPWDRSRKIRYLLACYAAAHIEEELLQIGCTICQGIEEDGTCQACGREMTGPPIGG